MASLADRIGLLAQAVAGRFKSIVGTPVVRTVALGTAYQASAPSKGAMVTVTLTSSANLSLTGGGTNTADIVIGTAASIASAGGTTIGRYGNSSTGTLQVGLQLSTIATNSYTIALPPGYWFAVRVTSGVVSVVSAFEQPLG